MKEEIKKYILDQAIVKHVCPQGAEGISKSRSIDDLLEMYVKDIDYCLSNDFPSNMDLLKIGGERLSTYGILIDDSSKKQNSKFTVLLGHCNVSLAYDGYTASTLFVKNKSEADIEVNGHAFVVIDCFDECIVRLHVGVKAKVLLNIYGKTTVHTTGPGIIKTVNKNQNTY
ncbi:hypothetical protein [Pedobacter antarcticus]|uniref:hypothetical protein n=1 Tax=Pedobacter antarcticus TaxID=34086 RepID=UPI001C56223F|nr:hypothetical protein [Pedobacter antarcticus]